MPGFQQQQLALTPAPSTDGVEQSKPSNRRPSTPGTSSPLRRGSSSVSLAAGGGRKSDSPSPAPIVLTTYQPPEGSTLIKSFPLPSHTPFTRDHKLITSLPTLPVPNLQDTVDKYLLTVSPLVNEADFQRTQDIAEQFLDDSRGGLGPTLQKRLLERAKMANELGPNKFLPELRKDEKGIALPTRNNWLIFREPVVINVSYFFSFPDDKRRKSQALRAATITSAAYEFRNRLYSGKLPPDTMRNVPLCPHQYRYLFNSCRMPAIPSDYAACADPEVNTHVAVARRNAFWTFDMMVDDGVGGKRQLTTHEVAHQLSRIMTETDNILERDPEAFPAVGILTSDDRDNWTANHAMLKSSDPTHASHLHAIESSVFMVCLDDDTPVTNEEVARLMWHGRGENRWFDKTCQFIVAANGKAGFLGEHSMMDATPTGTLGEFVCETIAKNGLDFSTPPTPSNPDLPEPTLLHFEQSPALTHVISDASVTFHALVSRHTLSTLRYSRYGKDIVKKFKVSPDAYAQMAIQLAYYRMYGSWVAVYETAGMRRYAWGRTETCRSVSRESVDFVKNWDDEEDAQSSYMASCQSGNGIDRHLLGLRLLLYPDEPIPEFFKDPAYALSKHWTLSTSQIPSDWFTGYGWGEVAPDGFGVAYMVRPDSYWFNVTGLTGGYGFEDFRESNGTPLQPNRVARFRHFLEEALDEMGEVMEQWVEAKETLESEKRAKDAEEELRRVMNNEDIQLQKTPPLQTVPAFGIAKPPSAPPPELVKPRPMASTGIARFTTEPESLIGPSRTSTSPRPPSRATAPPPLEHYFSRDVAQASHEVSASESFHHHHRPGHRRSVLEPQISSSIEASMRHIETAATPGITNESLGLSLAYPPRHVLSEMVLNEDEGVLEGLAYVDVKENRATAGGVGTNLVDVVRKMFGLSWL
ncbi:Carnitine O-acetyltransferase mitochondrial [Gonapodya sp. JEL0774]|nr:Carnitine O-acetyltransferase mitochondrial [Gonapodya sp. JEL0774]